MVKRKRGRHVADEIAEIYRRKSAAIIQERNLPLSLHMGSYFGGFKVPDWLGVGDLLIFSVSQFITFLSRTMEPSSLRNML